MVKKIFVGNLPLGFTEKELSQLFSQFKPVSVKLVMNQKTGRPKEFGFITFQTEETARNAMSQMDGKEVYGRKLVVNDADERN